MHNRLRKLTLEERQVQLRKKMERKEAEKVEQALQEEFGSRQIAGTSRGYRSQETASRTQRQPVQAQGQGQRRRQCRVKQGISR